MCSFMWVLEPILTKWQPVVACGWAQIISRESVAMGGGKEVSVWLIIFLLMGLLREFQVKCWPQIALLRNHPLEISRGWHWLDQVVKMATFAWSFVESVAQPFIKGVRINLSRSPENRSAARKKIYLKSIQYFTVFLLFFFKQFFKIQFSSLPRCQQSEKAFKEGDDNVKGVPLFSFISTIFPINSTKIEFMDKPLNWKDKIKTSTIILCDRIICRA